MTNPSDILYWEVTDARNGDIHYVPRERCVIGLLTEAWKAKHKEYISDLQRKAQAINKGPELVGMALEDLPEEIQGHVKAHMDDMQTDAGRQVGQELEDAVGCMRARYIVFTESMKIPVSSMRIVTMDQVVRAEFG